MCMMPIDFEGHAYWLISNEEGATDGWRSGGREVGR